MVKVLRPGIDQRIERDIKLLRSLGELAQRLGCELEGDPSIEITGPATIDDAGPGEVTFVANPRYQSRLAQSRAAAVIVANVRPCSSASVTPHPPASAAPIPTDRTPAPGAGQQE